MEQNTERELKMLLTKEQYLMLLSSFPFNEQIIQRNTYYDTEKGELKNKGCALRTRTIGTDHILTLKMPKDSITKYEFEYPVSSSHLNQLAPSELEKISSHMILPKNLQPITTFTTVRNVLNLKQGELCLDLTRFLNAEDYELEYEYHVDHNGIEVLNQLLKPFHLQYEKNGPSKIARAIQYQSDDHRIN